MLTELLITMLKNFKRVIRHLEKLKMVKQRKKQKILHF